RPVVEHPRSEHRVTHRPRARRPGCQRAPAPREVALAEDCIADKTVDLLDSWNRLAAMKRVGIELHYELANRSATSSDETPQRAGGWRRDAGTRCLQLSGARRAAGDSPARDGCGAGAACSPSPTLTAGCP